MTKEEQKKYNKQYYESHKTKQKEYGKQYYESHKQKRRIYFEQYRESKKNHCIYLLELPNHQIYVGSTNNLYKRLYIHKEKYIKFPNRKLYQAITANGGWDNVKIHTLMDGIPFKDLRLKLEQFYIDIIPKALSLNTNNVLVNQ